MRRGQRNVLLFGGLAIAGYLITSSFASSIGSPEEIVENDVEAEAEADPLATPYAAGPSTPEDLSSSPPPGDSDDVGPLTRSYAVALHELPGLPPDTTAGARVEIWAIWKPPMTKKRQVQKLVAEAYLERIAPPVTPEGPPVAVLSVPEKELDDLLFGDRFAELSASVIP